jgi:hypothetical protein
MNSNIMNNTAVFLKRYWWLLFLAVIAGNVMVWKKYKDAVPVYEQTLVVKVRGQYYDNSRRVFESISDPGNWKTKNIFNLEANELEKVKSISMNSYRNEDTYILEIRLNLLDSATVKPLTDSIVSYIHRDPFFKLQFYDRMESIDEVLNQSNKLIQQMSAMPPSINRDSALLQMQNLLELRFKRIEVLRYKEGQLRELELLEPSTKNIHFIPVSTFRMHLVFSILFFIIGFFLAVLIDQLRKKNN